MKERMNALMNLVYMYISTASCKIRESSVVKQIIGPNHANTCFPTDKPNP